MTHVRLWEKVRAWWAKSRIPRRARVLWLICRLWATALTLTVRVSLRAWRCRYVRGVMACDNRDGDDG